MPPAPTATPAAAAPAAAPAKPAAPAPAAERRAPVQPPPEKPMEQWSDDAGAELDQMDADSNKPRPATKPKAADKPKPEAENGMEELEETPAETAPEIPPTETETPAAPAAEVDPSKMGARDLRKAYEGSQKKIRDELQPKITKLETRIKELETAAPAADGGALAEKYKSIEKRNAELEQHIRFTDYSKSQEFNDKFQKPYIDAWDNARQDVLQLTVEERDGSTRPATDEDIQTLASLKLGERITKANAMFGDAAQEVLAHVRKIRDLSDAQIRALEDARTNANTMAEQRQLQTREQQVKAAKMWEVTNKELAEKYPKWFAPVEGDAEGNRLLDQGTTLTNLLFHPGAKLTPDQIALLPKFAQTDLQVHGKLSPESTVRVHAIIRNKAANHDRLARQLKTVRAELEEAKKSLSAYEASEPGTGGGAPGRRQSGFVDPQGDADAELDALDRKGVR